MTKQPEVDLRIDGTTKTYQLTVTYDTCVIPLDAEQASQLVADLSAGMSLLMAQDSAVSIPAPATSSPRHARAITARVPEGEIKWHRSDTGKYYAHPTPDVTLKAERGEKGWVAILNGEVISDTIFSKAAAQQAVKDALSTQRV